MHVMSFFLIMAQRLYLHATLVAKIYFPLNESISTYPSGVSDKPTDKMSHKKDGKVMHLNRTLKF